jgi:hypothetical protein
VGLEIRVFNDLQTHFICIRVLVGSNERISDKISLKRSSKNDVGSEFEGRDLA